MKTAKKPTVTVQTVVQLPPDQAWQLWTTPGHITQWNFATDEWCCPESENDLRPGGRFRSRMEAKDGSAGFDFTGIYDQVTPHRQIGYKLDGGRQVSIDFIPQDGGTRITQQFEVEGTHSTEQQQSGWQAIMDNFRKYAEAKR